MRIDWWRSVRFRFSVLTLVLVLVISLVFVAGESYRSYQREVDRLNRQLSQIEQSHIPSIVSSLWLTDYDLLQSQIEAIVRFPYVDRVEVVDDEGAVFSAGVVGDEGLVDQARTLTYSRRGTAFEIGSLRLSIDQAGLRAEALRTELSSAIGHLIAAVLIALAVAFLFRRQVGTHLERLAVYVENARIPEEESRLQLRRKQVYGDELDKLANAINDMHNRLQADLRERELLVSEVHHRIKNDMSFVKALLSLQASRSDTPRTAAALNEASQRVAVMSQIYERLYRSDSFREVELRPLVEQIIGDFRARGVLPPDAVKLVVEPVSVPTRVSVAVGVILNELVTNAVKYAFAQTATPRIVVTVRTDEDEGVLELTVADNGDGMPDDVVDGRRLGYGLTIARALAEQHNGSLDLHNDDGAMAVARLSHAA